MSITFKTITAPEILSTQDLLTRAQESPKSPITEHYVAISGTDEVAFISIDRLPQIGVMALYEIFVAKKYRGRGFGGKIMSKVELLAKEEGFKTIKLKPHPLDPETSKEKLINWYINFGFCPDPEIPGDLFKNI